ncbi:AraC family transcriptional regulator [Larsenimonas rhizosphaerae]|uniref:AraC family transcriptional regulator n=1 Tax=Larsenimonas rhizosphaerae TaxID=2944682 RepID=A0AA42CXZ1_9GAMM|nr:AraC family transcriptional regulator [Larsenimonas rhizosphaerae]MCM2129787.1 AraC family transcriptional regulator [Larsenimonas rhizosphaerae]MCX2524450.1 AraC family transcriptional regulator [Larsenimonas rhizosphaerae]
MTTTRSDWCVQSPLAHIERIEARFQGHAYSMHRHDTYAIGITLQGIQSFHYRSTHLSSVPGTVIVVHPDELHDGHAGDEQGFQYRMLYVRPALIQSILGGRSLPYLEGGLSRDPRLVRAVQALLSDMTHATCALEETDGLFDLAMALDATGDTKAPRTRQSINHTAAERVRQYLDAHWQDNVSLELLETLADRERWSLSKDFRALFGTSPYRYLTLRRLDHTRQFIAEQASLSEAAFRAGFADQAT